MSVFSRTLQRLAAGGVSLDMNTAAITAESLLRHEAFVLALARSLVRDESAAEDVAQQTWLAALEQRARPSSERGWLARVVQSRASNWRRGESRRAEREQLAARAEAQSSAAEEREDLELQHRVVGAVLALDEPYRSVVVAVYYAGRSPQDVARERGVPASTVRSQLSRALDMLRARLDRERGSRGAWFGALGLWVRRRDVVASNGAPAAGASGALVPAIAWTSTLVAAGVLAFAVWRRFEPAPTSGAAAPALAQVVAPIEGVAADAAEDGSDERASAPVAGEARETSAEEPPAELAALLRRMRQLKSVLLERALEPEPDIAARYAPYASRGVGVARLLARERFGFDVDLPWLDGGGAFFSFTERSHDYQSLPQIGIQGQVLDSGFYGGTAGLVLELGDMPAEVAFGEPRLLRGWLDDRTARAWDYVQQPVDLAAGIDIHALRGGLNELGFCGNSQVRAGQVYVVRALELETFDVLAILRIERVLEGDGVTFAWRLLESRDVPNPKTRHAARGAGERASLEPIPADVLAMTPDQQLFELRSIRERGSKLLLEAPVELQPLAAALAQRADAGVVRLLDSSEPWTEFLSVRAGGAYYSFVTQSHSYDDEPDIECQAGHLLSGFYGPNAGWFVELGDVPLDSARGQHAADPAAWDFVWSLELPYSDGQERVNEAWNKARNTARELGLSQRIEIRPNTTWLLRSVLLEEHDVLVALRVVASDEYGHFVEWRLLESWPVARTGR